jgi:UrcA family protein
MRRKSMKFPALTVTILGATMLAAATAPAVAADSSQEGAITSYTDLDLGTATGRSELARRYDQAAREKCGIAEGQKANYKERSCYRITGEQYRHFAEAILAQHDQAGRNTKYGLAAR